MIAKQTKGKCNSIIRNAIASGLRLDVDGHIILPSGVRASYSQSHAGYFRVSLGPTEGRRAFNVARIVCWLTHGDPPHETSQADHINRVRSDDSPENLRWATASQNALNTPESVRANWGNPCNLPQRRGQDHTMAKLTDHDVTRIRHIWESPCRPSQREIARRFGINQSQVQRIISGKRWGHIRAAIANAEAKP